MTARNKDGLRASVISWAVFWLCAFCPAKASAFQVPDDGFFPGWTKDGRSRAFQKMDLFNHINGGAELYLEFGFENLTVQRYAKAGAELILEIYEMENPAAALGLYLMQSGRETPWPEFAERNSSEPEQAVFVKGRWIVQVNNLSGEIRSVPAMKALAGRVLAAIREEPAVTLLNRVPAEGKIPGSERLIRGPLALQQFFTFGEGDILRLGGRVFGMLADYEGASGSTFTRLIIPYEDGPAAASAFSYLREHLDPYLKTIQSGPDGFTFEDFARRRGRVGLAKNVLDIRFKMAAAE